MGWGLEFCRFKDVRMCERREESVILEGGVSEKLKVRALVVTKDERIGSDDQRISELYDSDNGTEKPRIKNYIANSYLFQISTRIRLSQSILPSPQLTLKEHTKPASTNHISHSQSYQHSSLPIP